MCVCVCVCVCTCAGACCGGCMLLVNLGQERVCVCVCVRAKVTRLTLDV